MSADPIRYPETIEIQPLAAPPQATVRVPGSKSITNRALVLAALSRTGCTLRGALRSEDTEVMVDSLQRLGFAVEPDWPSATIRLSRPAGDAIIPAAAADLFVANSGTSMRFLTAMVALGHGRYRLDGIARMRERPIEDLLAALRQLGAEAASEAGTGCPPVVITAAGMRGGRVHIRGDLSSQFLSGLLLALPLADAETLVDVEGRLVSRPYVDMTLAMMRDFGVRVHETDFGFRIAGHQRYQRSDYEIEPDASAASYFFALAAITGGKIEVSGLGAKSLQGDVHFADILGRMGCRVAHHENSIEVKGGRLRGVEVDMNAISDTVMTLAAVACFAEGVTTIRNVAHIRHKETDRLAALATEVRKLGAEVEEFEDGLSITPGPLHGAAIDTYNDHRMAMSLALVGLRIPGVIIRDPACVAKTYPEFFQDLERLK
jgi:3-phosphoshikimate 1-carboxyvinyltransferase